MLCAIILDGTDFNFLSDVFRLFFSLPPDYVMRLRKVPHPGIRGESHVMNRFEHCCEFQQISVWIGS